MDLDPLHLHSSPLVHNRWLFFEFLLLDFLRIPSFVDQDVSPLELNTHSSSPFLATLDLSILPTLDLSILATLDLSILATLDLSILATLDLSILTTLDLSILATLDSVDDFNNGFKNGFF